MSTEEEYNGKANYVKIAPKMSPMLKMHQGMLFIKCCYKLN